MYGHRRVVGSEDLAGGQMSRGLGADLDRTRDLSFLCTNDGKTGVSSDPGRDPDSQQ
jgi:hypothetical protein